ncbi:hypothetical protein EVAR_92208_1 [Eumeta japonica]|uniref:Mariner Mos1 transposase n=1 Tax=Eumeta variegata TaxID=151549 RepID=A0A4C1TNJ5_EUMVA|nr:hypothetical protein EVAR_92208_1 [Eumeta japonica]
MSVQRRHQTNKVEAGKKRWRKNDCVFFSKTGPVCTIPVEEQKTVKGERYSTICLLSILEKVREKRPRIRILLYRDNASPHIANKMMSFLTSEKIKLVTHPAFNRDLAPCDFFIIPKIWEFGNLTFTGPEEPMIAFNQHVQNMLLKNEKRAIATSIVNCLKRRENEDSVIY